MFDSLLDVISIVLIVFIPRWYLIYSNKKYKKVDKGKEKSYFRLSYRKRFIDNVIGLPLLTITVIIILSLGASKFVMTLGIMFIIELFAELIYNLYKWRKYELKRDLSSYTDKIKNLLKDYDGVKFTTLPPEVKLNNTVTEKHRISIDKLSDILITLKDDYDTKVFNISLIKKSQGEEEVGIGDYIPIFSGIMNCLSDEEVSKDILQEFVHAEPDKYNPQKYNHNIETDKNVLVTKYKPLDYLANKKLLYRILKQEGGYQEQLEAVLYYA